MPDYEYSLKALDGGTSQALAVSTTSAPSAAISAGDSVVVTPTVDVFFRKGSAPVAVSDGTDQFLLANSMYRLAGISGGEKLAFKTASGTGTVYITFGA